MVNEFIRIAKRSTILIRPGVVLTIPPKLTNVERRAVQEFVKELGAEKSTLSTSPGGCYRRGPAGGHPLREHDRQHRRGFRLGAVISISGIVCLASERFGGNSVDTAIIRYLRERHISPSAPDRGMDQDQLRPGGEIRTRPPFRYPRPGPGPEHPRMLTINTSEIREAISRPVAGMIKVLMSLLEKVPPELSGDLVDRGMTLTGGGSLLEGLGNLITTHTGVRTRIAPNALTAAVEGAGRMLEDFTLYRKFFVEAIEENEQAERSDR